ncbi:MAG: hypothetical protein ACOCT9_03060 [archaeon]
MSYKSQDYSKPFSYHVPGLEGYELPTQQAVWDKIDKKASEKVVIPDNIDKIRAQHEKKLDKLIENENIITPKITLAYKGYHRNSLIFHSIIGEYYLGLKKYGNDIEDDVFYYYKELELNKLYLDIAKYCSALYFPKDFCWLDLPPFQYNILNQEEISYKIKNINKLQRVQNTKNLAIKLYLNRKIPSLMRELDPNDTKRTFTPEQAMTIFLNRFDRIRIISRSFLKQVIVYHLQQQKESKSKYRKESRKLKDRKNKKKLTTKADFKYFLVFNYIKNNPNASLKQAKKALTLIASKTVKKYWEKIHKES